MNYYLKGKSSDPKLPNREAYYHFPLILKYHTFSNLYLFFFWLKPFWNCSCSALTHVAQVGWLLSWKAKVWRFQVPFLVRAQVWYSLVEVFLSLSSTFAPFLPLFLKINRWNLKKKKKKKGNCTCSVPYWLDNLSLSQRFSILSLFFLSVLTSWSQIYSTETTWCSTKSTGLGVISF